jgi:hypothetical protein
MACAQFFATASYPQVIRVATMATHDTPQYFNFVLQGAELVLEAPRDHGFVKRIFQVRFLSESGAPITMFLEEETDGSTLVVPIHHMYLAGDALRTPFFMMM